MILIDYSPLLISAAHSAESWKNKRDSLIAKGKGVSEEERAMKVEEIHMFRMLNTLRMLNVKYRRKYGELVFCIDRKPYWRSEYFPNYKKNRKPMNKTMDWSMYFKNSEEILDAAEHIFGWKVIDVPGIEADDSIGVLVHKIQDQNHMIVSPDGDFKQLHGYKNVAQWDAIRNKAVVEKDPAKWLRLKIITGDRKDGIPNIVSDKDVFMTENTKQNSIKSVDKKAWSDAENPLFFCDGDMLERWKFNEKMLDMSKVPDEQVDLIMTAWNTPAKPKGDIYSYFAGNGYSRFIDTIGDFK